MSEIYVYICTKSTIDPVIPPSVGNVAQLARYASDAFLSIAGGIMVLGKLAMFPVQRAVPFHLLCDGSEVPKTAFPELYDYLQDSQGVATDPDYFVLPNYLTGLDAATTAETETVTDGAVSTPSSPTTGDPPPDNTGSIAPVRVGVVDSGGRIQKFPPEEPLP